MNTSLLCSKGLVDHITKLFSACMILRVFFFNNIKLYLILYSKLF